MASFLRYIQITIILFIIYAIIRLFEWFLSPYVIDKNDKLPTLRPYQFIDPSIKTHTANEKFPTINDKATKTISLIFPAYNEENRIRACLDPTIKYLISRQKKNSFSWEIIVVNDGSKDKTCDIVQEYALKHSTDKVRLLNYSQNQGKGFAVQQV